MAYQHKTLTCRDCGAQFTFTEGEQEFYASRGLTNNPSRCPDCRAAHKRARGSTGGYSGGSGQDRGGSYSSGGSYGGSREMYEVTCDSCGRPARVPFQPRGDRPVYCSDCFQSQRPTRSGGRDYNRY